MTPEEMNALLLGFDEITTCDTCRLPYTVTGLKRHACKVSSRLHETKFSWAYCPFLRLALKYSPGESFGDETGIPIDLRGIALSAANVLEANPDVRVEFFKAFRQTSNHAYISGAKQNKLAKLLEESGEEGQRVMTAFTQWATSCPRPMKQQLAPLEETENSGPPPFC